MPPPPPPPRPDWPIPVLNLRIDDLSHPGAKLFLDNVDATKVMEDAVVAVLLWLYATPEKSPKKMKTMLLVLREMEGVAYTTGSETEKEIHFNVQHIVNSKARAADEIRGVLTHEAVHCFQYDAKGTCPGGLVEGIADYVRLRAGFVPPHWRPGGDRWDAGYQVTGYFLHWLEERYGDGTVRDINAALKDTDYNESIFHDATGRKVEKLWKLYCEHSEVDGGNVDQVREKEEEGVRTGATR